LGPETFSWVLAQSGDALSGSVSKDSKQFVYEMTFPEKTDEGKKRAHRRYADGVVRLYRKVQTGESPNPELEFIDYGISALSASIVAEWGRATYAAELDATRTARRQLRSLTRGARYRSAGMGTV
jgi:hypothetical protein